MGNATSASDRTKLLMSGGGLYRRALLAQMAYEHVGSSAEILATALVPLRCELVDKVYDQSHDTHAFVCIDHTPDPTATTDRVLRVLFRGTASIRNVRTDLDVEKEVWPWPRQPAPCGARPECHKGMTDGYGAVRDRIRAACSPYMPVIDLETGGHSLGASESVACAADLAAKYWHAAPRVSSVNFGCPHYGDAAFAEMYAAVVPYTLRVIHDLDIIPTVPMNLNARHPEWVHVGEQLRILDNGKVATRMGSWLRHLWADLTGRAESDHPVARYLAAIKRMAA